MPPRYALALHGRLGTLYTKPQQSIELHMNASRRIARFSGASIRKHIVGAQGDGAAVDVFVHSWNPERAALIDTAYGPVEASLHEPPQRHLPKAQSQALSIARVAGLIAAHEHRVRIEYTLVLVLRLDVVVASPLSLSLMDRAHIWFAESCCLDRADSPDERLEVRAACGDGAGFQQSSTTGWWSRRHVRRCRVDHFGHPVCGKKWCGSGGGERRSHHVNAAYYLADWWFAASSAVVQTWHEIVRRWDHYLARSRELYIAYEPPKLWSHFLWAMHVREVLNRTRDARFLPSSDFRIVLARVAWPQTHAPRGCPLDLVHMLPAPLSAGRPHPSASIARRAALPQQPAEAGGGMGVEPAHGEAGGRGHSSMRSGMRSSSMLDVWRASCSLDAGEGSRTASKSVSVCCGRQNRGGAFRTCGTAMPRDALADAKLHEAACAAGREAILPFAVAACKEDPELDEPSDLSPKAPCHMAALARRRAKARASARMNAKRRRAAAAERRAARLTALNATQRY